MRGNLKGAVLCLVLLPAAAFGRDGGDVLMLAPGSDWQLHYGEERCSLARSFGEGENAVFFRLDSYGSPNAYRLLLVGEPIRLTSGPSGTVRYRLSNESDLRPEEVSLQGQVGEAPAISFSIMFGTYFDPRELNGLAPAAYEAFWRDYGTQLAANRREVNSLEFRTRGDPVRLELGPMGAPLEALEACVDDLHSHWGFDPVSHRQLQRPPRPKPQTVHRMQQRYPSRMVMEGLSAHVPVRMAVDAQGRPGECVVQTEGVDEAFTNAVCRGLAREFEPALDRQGNPVAAIFHTSVIFLMD